MPGRRLTRADRQRIAAGLARGLDYVQIARQLGRPTSTVSREVARNGGPGRYRAELAQLATTHRARRRPSPPAATRQLSESSGPDPGTTAAFVTELTAALIETGLPRTAAGIMACLFTSETGSRTAAELASHLQVSAATISHAVALLDQQALIRRDRDHGGRRHRYHLDEDAGFRSVLVGARANQRLAATVLRGADIFGACPATEARLTLAGRFLEQIGNDIIRSVRQHRPDLPTP
ncbi:MarR family transcriptional regulator [Actinoplanes sp. ATCC 53533]|uniref:helix-turn-helix domain-containing protein n=1 Tax=Actinoplanes sp. ATCC 53533 TaxID=1288362 RepID=UPI000F7AB885|nr:helix-turn-helix domain-containing protein [Actinoplanes sp. ATCC 53533]RSM48948.1 MarR family transcriptional regulator [Actinoplanes sp. ATCC 53533]